MSNRDLPNFVASEPLAVIAELTAAEKTVVPRNAKCLCGSGKKFKHRSRREAAGSG